MAHVQLTFTVTITPHIPGGWADKWKTKASDPIVLGFPPMLPVLAKAWAGRVGICQDVTVRPRVVIWRSGWPGPGSAAQESPIYHTWNLFPCNTEMGICVFPNSSLFQCKFTLARHKRGCGGSLHSKRNKRKQRDTSFPSPKWPVDLFPGKMCRGRERLCGCCQDSEPRSAVFPGAQVWVLSPKSNGASGFGQEGIVQPSPGRNHLPTRV